VLAQCQGRAGPNLEQITRDLDVLLGAAAAEVPAAAPVAAGAPGTAAVAPAADGKSAPDSLDMT